MGWEQRGNHRYYYRKEREGSRVKSVYVGRGEIAHMVVQIQSGSSVIEKFARSTDQDDRKTEKAELVFEQVTQLWTQAALLTASAVINGGLLVRVVGALSGALAVVHVVLPD